MKKMLITINFIQIHFKDEIKEYKLKMYLNKLDKDFEYKYKN